MDGRQAVSEHTSVTNNRDQGSLVEAHAAQSVVKQSRRSRKCFKSVPIAIIHYHRPDQITNRKIRGPFPKIPTHYRWRTQIPRKLISSKVVSVKKWIWVSIRKYPLMERTSLKLINFYLTHLNHMFSSRKRINSSEQTYNNLTPITQPQLWLNHFSSTSHGMSLTSLIQKRKTS